MAFIVIFDRIMAMEDRVPYSEDFDEICLNACRQGVINMLKERALHDDTVVMGDKDGNPILVKAQEVLDKNPNFDKDVEYNPVEE